MQRIIPVVARNKMGTNKMGTVPVWDATPNDGKHRRFPHGVNRAGVGEMTGKFHCRCCGACCRIKDGIVRVSDAEIARIAAFLGMSEADFIEQETDVAPDRRSLMLKSLFDGSCAYLTADNLCRINPVKPDKCRTFPFDWKNPDSDQVCPALS